VIEEILPPAVVSAETFSYPVAPPALFPEEEPARAGWSPVRRAEFATVRMLARLALGGLGLPPVPIPRGDQGAPVWPAGVVGSMTHCPGYGAAAVGRRDEVLAIGVDAEQCLPLPPGVLDVISRPGERREIQRLSDSDPDVCWDRLLFSAKETLYKAWFPLTHRWLDFEDVEVQLEPDGTMAAHLLVPGPRVGRARADDFSGRWLLRGDLLATAIAIPPSAGVT
jgi:4'-phosphopantetheinyl transferase EntD